MYFCTLWSWFNQEFGVKMNTTRTYCILVSESPVVVGMVIGHKPPKVGHWYRMEHHQPLLDGRGGLPLHMDKHLHLLLHAASRILSHQLVYPRVSGFGWGNGQTAVFSDFCCIVGYHFVTPMVPQEGWLGMPRHPHCECNCLSLRDVDVLRKLLNDWLWSTRVESNCVIGILFIASN